MYFSSDTLRAVLCWAAAGLAFLVAASAYAEGPIRFDEAEFATGDPIDGLEITSLDGVPVSPIAFGFTVGGVSSRDARVSDEGPGTTSFISAPAVEGTTQGVLTVEFAQPAAAIGFSIALSVGYGLADRVIVRGVASDGVVVAQQVIPMREDGLFAGGRAEVSAHTGFDRVEILFSSRARRFLLDNLTWHPMEAGRPSRERGVKARGLRATSAVSPDGRLAVAWADCDSHQVLVQLFDALGNSVSDELPLQQITAAPLDPLDPQELLCPQNLGLPKVFFDRQSRLVAAAGGRFKFFDGQHQIRRELAVTSTAQGASVGKHVVFVWKLADGPVRAQVYDADGVPRSTAFDVTSSQRIVSLPAVAGVSAETFLLAWQGGWSQNAPTLRVPGIWAQVYNLDGVALGPAVRLDLSENGSANSPVLASNHSGQSVLAWQEEDLGGVRVLARQIRSSVGPLGGVIEVGPGELARNPSVAVGVGGEFAIAYELLSRDPAGDLSSTVRSRFYDSAGSFLETGDVGGVNDGSMAFNPSVGIDDQGRTTLVYQRRSAIDLAQGVFSLDFEPFAVTALPTCVESSTILCLQGERFRVEVAWQGFTANDSGVGRSARLTSDTGSFWFFHRDNVELLVKVLDGTGINGHFWFFAGALTNVEYQITVTDTLTGESKVYSNPLGTFASFGDSSAFPASVAADSVARRRGRRSSTTIGLSAEHTITWQAGLDLESLQQWAPKATTRGIDAPGHRSPRVEWRAPASDVSATCVASPSELCIQKDRFTVEVDWSDFQGNSGGGVAVPMTADTGRFWFFEESNVEMAVKVLDGRAVNGHFWVFYGALTNVRYTLKVTDTETGAVRVYENPLGSFGSVGDTGAFLASP